MDPICDDLVAEHDSLDELVAGIDEATWDRATESPGWSIRDQVSHLWFFDQRALMALTDPDAFAADAAELMRSGGTEASVVPGRSMTGAAMLVAWRRDRGRLVDVARGVDPSARVPWYGPAMGARSFVTARLMETWAHGQDVADALGAEREPTDRLRHVAHIGVRARPFSYAIRKMAMPDADVHVALTTPSGDTVTYGAPSSPDVVRGPLLDFCLVVTQRRHRVDTALEVHGPAAEEWMSIAQAFAGEPGPGRPPRETDTTG
ncbi:MAG: TIGR03084 family protein [Actinobacteria bacterium]|jgi:uncharacterized protein (TIGR03084 family)|uniref:Unannotated protein n=1 Tax=freshwater metagenome TaxID=449393 RepID=A0A6J6BJC0_9ZZZZ|nr:TIGR03084 family protein [Actinomycetota bacterium]